jgi:hypothetical protein
MDERERSFIMPEGKYENTCPAELATLLQSRGCVLEDYEFELNGQRYTEIYHNATQLGEINATEIELNMRHPNAKNIAALLEGFTFTDAKPTPVTSS